MGSAQQSDRAIARPSRKDNSRAEVLLRLRLLRWYAARLGVTLKQPVVESPDCIFVGGLNELLIWVHRRTILRLAAEAARSDFVEQGDRVILG